MDTISHILIGAVTGEIVAGNRQGKKAALWGAAIANIPDLDVIAQPFLSSAQSLLFHRGPTHSILFCILLTPLLAKLLTRIHKGTKTDFYDWIKLSACCLFSHIFIDCFNSYGTAVLYPFSNVRVAFDCIGIVDVFLILPFVLALLCFVFVKRRTQARKIIAISAMLLSALYLAFAVNNKITLEKKIKNHFAQTNLNYDRILTSPLPLTNFVWLVIVEDEDGFFSANYSLKSGKIVFERYFLKNHKLAKSFENDKEYQHLERFSKGYYCLRTADNGDIMFYDLRIASFDFDGTANLENAVFTHQLSKAADGKLKIKHNYPKRKISREKLKRYYEQIVGN